MTELRTARSRTPRRIPFDGRALGWPILARGESGGHGRRNAGDRRGPADDNGRPSPAKRSGPIAKRGPLAAVRAKSHDDLMATLAWIRELVSMIHLPSSPASASSRAEELVAQIAASVEGISAVAAGKPLDRPSALEINDPHHVCTNDDPEPIEQFQLQPRRTGA